MFGGHRNFLLDNQADRPAKMIVGKPDMLLDVIQ